MQPASPPPAPPAPWTWDQLDFVSTGALLVVLALIAFIVAFASALRLHDGSVTVHEGGKVTRNFAPRVVWARMLPAWTLAIVTLAGGALIALAAEKDPAGLFGNVTAAWVQAVGTVAAIIAAALIAGQQVRQQQKAQLDAEDRAAYARLAAIYSVASAFREAAEKLKVTPPGGLSGNDQLKTELGDESRAIIRGAEAVLQSLFNDAANVPTAVHNGLARAHQLAAAHRAKIEEGNVVWGDVNGAAFRQRVFDAADELTRAFERALADFEGARRLDERRAHF